MEYILLAIALTGVGIFTYFYFRKSKKDPVTPKAEPREWQQLLEDLKTALAGIKEETELIILLTEFEPRVVKWRTNLTFMKLYNNLVKNWKLKHKV